MNSEEPRVTVAVRIRPKITHAASALQQSERYEEVVCVPTSDASLRLVERRATKVNRTMHFAYDHVFDLDATQEEVYEAAALDAVDSVLGGTNASLLTYGQTGSGKTHTVLGTVGHTVQDSHSVTEAVGPDSGLLLRAIQDMLTFAERVLRKEGRHVVLGITAIEIYNDDIRDLLREGVATAPLQPIMTRDALHFPGLTHMPLRSVRDACAVYERAAARRVQRATSANDTSSRSHALFTVEVFQTPPLASGAPPPSLAECCALRDAQAMAASGASARATVRCECFDGAPTVLRTAKGVPVMCSALTVADLAGSEKAKHADVHGAGFDELRRINASLTALGNVVHHLYHGSSHIPYRDSKLTMVLRDTFAAPRARVVLFVNVSPTALTCEETLSSLYFADKMKGMTVADTAASPQQAALQAGYLASLRAYDTLLAETHIFHAQHELSTGLLQRVASTDADHPLFQLPFHSVLGEGQDKAARMRQLCGQLKREVSVTDTPETRMRRFADAAQREMVKELLKKYSLRRADAHARTAAVEQANAELQAQHAAAEAAMRRTLTAEKAAVRNTQLTRQELSKSRAMCAAQLAGMEKLLATPLDEASACEGITKDCATPAEAEEEGEREAHDAAAHTLHKALELAELRHTLFELVAFNVRTSPPPSPTPNRTDSSVCASAAGTAKSRSRSGTASSLAAKHVTVEGWLRGAVLAMAGNAVVQSTKRKARDQQQQQQQQQPVSRPALGDVTNLISNTAHKTQQLPKFWKVLQQSDTARPLATNADTAPHAHGGGGSAATGRLRSAFDDPALFTRVTAYMDMGASLMKVDRAGRLRSRWFYLSQKEDRCMLCWDESRRRADMTGGGHVYLDAVEKISLGRSSPGFLKHQKLTGTAVTEDDVCRSFTVVYHPRAHHRDLKFVDIVCPDRAELETWVVGLSHWSGVRPIFEDSHQPIDPVVAVEATDEGCEDDGSVAKASEAKEAVLCRAWHIPAEVLRQARVEVDARRSRHPSGRMRLTPGELRDLTGMDIFRASAMWRHFEKEGWVANPTKELRCFVE